MDPDPDPDPAIFAIDLPKVPSKNKFLNKFFCLLLFEGTCKKKIKKNMYIIFNDKKSKRSHKAVGIKVFLTFFAW